MLQFNKYYPDSKLRNFIHSYFVLELNIDSADYNEDKLLDEGFSNHPQGTIDLMFSVRGGIVLSNFKGSDFILNKIFIMAQQEGFFKINFQPDTYVIGIVFYAESFVKLFNLPLDELKNSGQNIDMDLDVSYHDLHENLCLASSVSQIVQKLDYFLINKFSQADYSYNSIDLLIQYIRKNAGRLSVKELASLANTTERTLQRKMKNTTGVGPKSYSQVIRFKNVLELVNNNESLDWQDVLYRCGYFDQAHFIKDFKKFTGRTPNDFVNDRDDLSKMFLKD